MPRAPVATVGQSGRALRVLAVIREIGLMRAGRVDRAGGLAGVLLLVLFDLLRRHLTKVLRLNPKVELPVLVQVHREVLGLALVELRQIQRPGPKGVILVKLILVKHLHVQLLGARDEAFPFEDVRAEHELLVPIRVLIVLDRLGLILLVVQLQYHVSIRLAQHVALLQVGGPKDTNPQLAGVGLQTTSQGLQGQINGAGSAA
mmetsp:Transcript_6853/g.12982  ORF Transcript_6853/g.12982 Transcript_6853/m.12982 type:complete len:203 (-) Transcript_6853:1894-2502(-)